MPYDQTRSAQMNLEGRVERINKTLEGLAKSQKTLKGRLKKAKKGDGEVFEKQIAANDQTIAKLTVNRDEAKAELKSLGG